MKKIVMTLCLLAITTGVVNAQPIKPQPPHKVVAPQHRVMPAPKPMPVVYQVPVQTPYYSNYNNSPYLTFTLGNIDVTLGL